MNPADKEQAVDQAAGNAELVKKITDSLGAENSAFAHALDLINPHLYSVEERIRAYDAYLAERRRTLTALVDQQRGASLLPHPSPAECLDRARTRDRRLWERSAVDADFL